jgi:hypothetical protein
MTYWEFGELDGNTLRTTKVQTISPQKKIKIKISSLDASSLL